MQSRSVQNGFTIVEIMIVLGIIGILAAALYPAYRTYQESAKKSATAIEMKRVQLAIEKYHEEKEAYPADLNDLIKEDYYETKKKKLVDAWGNPYRWEITADGDNPYIFMSYGTAKGKKGDKSKVIDVWKL